MKPWESSDSKDTDNSTLTRRRITAVFLTILGLGGSGGAGYWLFTNREPPSMNISNVEYDWGSGRQIANVSIELNGVNSVVTRGLSDREITTTGTHRIEMESRSTELVGEFNSSITTGESSKITAEVPNDFKQLLERRNQDRLQKVLTTGLPNPTEDNTELYGKDFQWETRGTVREYKIEAEKRLYQYYTSEDNPNSYREYIDTPFDDRLFSRIAIEIDPENKDDSQYVSELFRSLTQSIDNTPSSIGSGYDKSPKYPTVTLFDGGDIEDISILIARFLWEFKSNTVLIRFPEADHTGVGIELESSNKYASGTYYTADDTKFYYIEPTRSSSNIGDLPSELEGEEVEIRQLTGAPVLVSEFEHIGTTTGGAPSYSVSISNYGSTDAIDVKAVYKIETESEVLDKQVITYDTLQPNETIESGIWLTPPELDSKVRLSVDLKLNGNDYESVSTDWINPVE